MDNKEIKLIVDNCLIRNYAKTLLYDFILQLRGQRIKKLGEYPILKLNVGRTNAENYFVYISYGVGDILLEETREVIHKNRITKIHLIEKKFVNKLIRK